jgi:hypothetical protein
MAAVIESPSIPPIDLSDGELQQLQGIASSRSLSHSSVKRAQINMVCGTDEPYTFDRKSNGRDRHDRRQVAQTLSELSLGACMTSC